MGFLADLGRSQAVTSTIGSLQTIKSNDLANQSAVERIKTERLQQSGLATQQALQNLGLVKAQQEHDEGEQWLSVDSVVPKAKLFGNAMKPIFDMAVNSKLAQKDDVVGLKVQRKNIPIIIQMFQSNSEAQLASVRGAVLDLKTQKDALQAQIEKEPKNAEVLTAQLATIDKGINDALTAQAKAETAMGNTPVDIGGQRYWGNQKEAMTATANLAKTKGMKRTPYMDEFNHTYMIDETSPEDAATVQDLNLKRQPLNPVQQGQGVVLGQGLSSGQSGAEALTSLTSISKGAKEQLLQKAINGDDVSLEKYHEIAQAGRANNPTDEFMSDTIQEMKDNGKTSPEIAKMIQEFKATNGNTINTLTAEINRKMTDSGYSAEERLTMLTNLKKPQSAVDIPDDHLRILADTVVASGNLKDIPSFGFGAAAVEIRKKFLNMVAEETQLRGMSGGDMFTRNVIVSSTRTALSDFMKYENKLLNFINLHDKNAKLVLAAADKVDNTGTPIINRWINAGKRSVAGDPELAQFDIYVRSVVNEFANIVSSSTAAGQQVSDTARKEAEALLNTRQSPAQVKASIKAMLKETQNRRDALEEQKKSMMDTIRTPDQFSANPVSGAPAPASAAPSGVRVDTSKLTGIAKQIAERLAGKTPAANAPVSTPPAVSDADVLKFYFGAPK